MWCPYCKEPSVFYHDFDSNTYTCNKCGKTFSAEKMRAYADKLQKEKTKEMSKYDIDPEDWRDFEDGWRPI